MAAGLGTLSSATMHRVSITLSNGPTGIDGPTAISGPISE